LGQQLGVTPAQIRKDLSYFGRFGKQGRGYNVPRLSEQLREILGLVRQWNLVVVGVGNLGRAILSYAGFAPEGFGVVAAFDARPDTIGRKIGGVVVRDVAELKDFLRHGSVDIGIVAVPASAAQEVIDALVQGGVRAILNYAPVAAQVPPETHVRDIDPVLQLQAMTFYLKNQKSSAK
jgi:redox-sensing transcriptional repressor